MPTNALRRLAGTGAPPRPAAAVLSPLLGLSHHWMHAGFPSWLREQVAPPPLQSSRRGRGVLGSEGSSCGGCWFGLFGLNSWCPSVELWLLDSSVARPFGSRWSGGCGIRCAAHGSWCYRPCGLPPAPPPSGRGAATRDTPLDTELSDSQGHYSHVLEGGGRRCACYEPVSSGAPWGRSD